MRCLRKVVFTIPLVAVLSLPLCAQETVSYQQIFASASPGARISAGTQTGWHQMTWVTSGNPGACQLQLDYSNDGLTWYLGGTIPAQDCTRSNQTQVIGPQNVAFVRMNVTALSNGAIQATYTGFASSPGGPAGTVTAVFGRTGQVLAQSGDYNVGLITGAAPLFSPNFQGVPTSPNPASGDISNTVATTQFVHQALLAGGGTAGVASFNGRTGAVMPLVGDYSAFYAPIGVTGSVSSVFGRTGNVVGVLGDYAGIYAPLASPVFSGNPTAPTPAPGDSSQSLATTQFVMTNGGVTSGTVNALAKYSATNTVAPANATEDGNLLSYFGAGGIVGLKFSNGSGSGGFQLESAAAPLPPLPGAGNNALVSGPDGFYVSNANTAYTKIGQGGGSVAGVSSFNTRTGNVTSQSGDYTVAQVSGAAPLASPTFTGSAQLATNPPSNDNSQAIPSTNWVQNLITGTIVAQPIAHSTQGPVCAVNNVATGAQATFSPVAIQNGDTVLIYVTSSNTFTGQVTYSLTDDGFNSWSTIDSRTQGLSPNMASATLIGTGANAAKAATTITLTQSTNGKFSACLATYTGVASFGTTNKTGASNTTGSTATVAVQAGGYMFAGAGIGGGAYTVSWTAGTGLQQVATATGAGVNATGICENTSATAASVSCTSLWTGSANNQIIGVPLNPGVSVPAATQVRVNLYKLSTINDVSIASVVTCSTAQCPDGYYRITILGIVTTVCTTGTAQVNMTYTNEVSSPTVGLLSSPMTFTSQNVVYATRPFHHNGTAPITISTTGVACTPTAGTGAANLRLTIERLQ